MTRQLEQLEQLEQFTDESHSTGASLTAFTEPGSNDLVNSIEIEAQAFAGKAHALLAEIVSTMIERATDLLGQAGNTRTWQHIKTVEQMQALQDDWNGYGSSAPNGLTRELATSILLSSAPILVPDRVSPSAEGGVGVCFYHGSKYADIECLNSGEIVATTSDRRERPQVWEVKPTEIKDSLKKIRAYLYA